MGKIKMKHIKIEGCNTCPYIRSLDRINVKYCSVLDKDEIHYLEDMIGYIKNMIYPIWCPLEDYDKYND